MDMWPLLRMGCFHLQPFTTLVLVKLYEYISVYTKIQRAYVHTHIRLCIVLPCPLRV